MYGLPQAVSWSQAQALGQAYEPRAMSLSLRALMDLTKAALVELRSVGQRVRRESQQGGWAGIGRGKCGNKNERQSRRLGTQGVKEPYSMLLLKCQKAAAAT